MRFSKCARPSEWRGLNVLPYWRCAFAATFAEFDAESVFLSLTHRCRIKVLRMRRYPAWCQTAAGLQDIPARVTPENPVGRMVSSEGLVRRITPMGGIGMFEGLPPSDLNCWFPRLTRGRTFFAG